jgi:CheY-like chemotaxis protein
VRGYQFDDTREPFGIMSANLASRSLAKPPQLRRRGEVDLDLLSTAPHFSGPGEYFDSEADTQPSVLEWTAPEPQLMHALIIDADRESRFYLRAKLVMADLLQTDEAATGGEALYLLKTRRYKLVILDLDLPDMDGWQLATRIGVADGRRALARHLMVTRGKLSWMDELKSRRVGAQHCLRKPLHPVELATALRSLT